MRALIAAAAAAVGFVAIAASGSSVAVAQEQAPVTLRTLHIQGNVHMIAGAGVNVVVQVGPFGPVVVDPGAARMGKQVLAAIRALSPRPVRYVINTHLHDDHTGANDIIAAVGSPVGQGRGSTVIGAGLQATRAEIIANEQVLQRMGNPPAPSKPAAVVLWPTTTYSNPSNSGGKTEGRTMIVPGHGRISDEADLVEYRDMVTIIRDRVQDLIEKKRTLEQVKAARPTMDFDGQYGHAPGWTSDQFIEAVYRGLTGSQTR